MGALGRNGLNSLNAGMFSINFKATVEEFIAQDNDY